MQVFENRGGKPVQLCNYLPVLIMINLSWSVHQRI